LTNNGNVVLFGCSTGLIYSYYVNKDFLKEEFKNLRVNPKMYTKHRGHESSITSLSLNYDGKLN
jgi:predicted CoA-binding protein